MEFTLPAELEAHEPPAVANVDNRLATMDQASVTQAPGRYPRGHYGFEVVGPDGVDVMVWTEEKSKGARR